MSTGFSESAEGWAENVGGGLQDAVSGWINSKDKWE
jgi:hypothetical protein